MLATLAFIAAGGFCGGISRYLATTKIHTLWGVVVANLLAGFLLGLLTTAPTQPWLLLLPAPAAAALYPPGAPPPNNSGKPGAATNASVWLTAAVL